MHPQSEGYTSHAEWDFEHNDQYPLLLHAPYFDLYRKQVVKQADLVLAMHWCGDRFTAGGQGPQRRLLRAPYGPRLLAVGATQAVMAAEVGHLDLAHDYAYEAAMIDLRDLQQNSHDGLHMASLAGAWIALVAGFGGFRDHGGIVTFDPVLPDGLTKLRFSLVLQGRHLTVDVRRDEVTYSMQPGDGELTIKHVAETITVVDGSPVVRPIVPRVALLPRPPQPPGRAPSPAAASQSDGPLDPDRRHASGSPAAPPARA